MLKSFFPSPVVFFLSVLLWSAISIGAWYGYGDTLGLMLGFNLPAEGAPPIIGLGFFVTPDFLWFYLYYLVASLMFYAAWRILHNHPWLDWSILGSALILFITYFSVQVSVAINHWRRPFGDGIQHALTGEEDITAEYMYGLIIQFAEIAALAVLVFAFTRFFVSHYIFRWRHAMNNYYVSYWNKLRDVEGASQRVQEDTMRFASIMENLGVSFVDAIMTLVAFLPLLWSMSEYVTELPFVGVIAQPLFYTALFWSIFGTAFLALVGIKLPGLQFHNQRVEAAYRKELVYGEDNHERAHPMTLEELFGQVRKNYFRIYFHYTYFNLARSLYVNADNMFTYIILIPTIVSGTITYGILQQILTAFGQVSNSFQYLISAWPTIVELLSVYKRLQSFERAIQDQPLTGLDKRQEP
ncbi:MAG: peptide antibiotic transporter SbmA [Gammaproteobacteria bacterium]|nr:peptide antibiotic transporter SbmA [Gammaproteobacteria bacterium]